MLIEITKLIDAPKSEVFAWCTDFVDRDPEYSHVRLRTRRVLERSHDRVSLEETGVLMVPFKARIQVQLHPPDWWEADAVFSFGKTHVEYKLTDTSRGTRLDVTIRMRGFLVSLFSPLKGYFAKKIDREWNDYVNAMERELSHRQHS